MFLIELFEFGSNIRALANTHNYAIPAGSISIAFASN